MGEVILEMKDIRLLMMSYYVPEILCFGTHKKAMYDLWVLSFKASQTSYGDSKTSKLTRKWNLYFLIPFYLQFNLYTKMGKRGSMLIMFSV